MDAQRLQLIADHHGFSLAAVSHLADRIRSGRGTMVQFNHPELGGPGQWMQGGMVMIGDLFNQSLQARVANLCQAVATEWQASSAPGGSQTVQVQFQGSPIAPPNQPVHPWNPMPPMNFGPADCWWPSTWGQPAIQGSQNHLDYAYFAPVNRLALRQGATVTFHDTTGYQITGFSQQQTTDSQGLICCSDRGLVAVRQFPRLV